MNSRNVAAAMFCETNVYDADLSHGRWKWLRASQLLPLPGDTTPRRGMGAFINKDILPGASVVKVYEDSFWVSVPGSGKNLGLYLCMTHLPMYANACARKKALQELKEGYKLFKRKGVIVFGGDFNARCGLNGDTFTGSCGRQLFNFCMHHCLDIVNALPICTGEFTREQDVMLEGSLVRRKTTIDYVLVPQHAPGSVHSMHIVDGSDLDSDHKPLLVELDWQRVIKNCAKAPDRCRIRYKVNEMNQRDWSDYETLCDNHMVQWIAGAQSYKAAATCESASIPLEDQANTLTETWFSALRAASVSGVGLKRVTGKTKPWFGKELASLYKLRTFSSSVLSLAEALHPNTAITDEARNTHRRINSICRSTKRSKKLAKEREDLAIIASAPHGSKLFWARWKARLRSLHADRLPDCALDADGKLVTEHIAVLKVWKDFVHQLGKEDPIAADPGDHATNSESEYDDEFARKIIASLRHCHQESSVPELDGIITWEEVHAAVRALKNGKSPGLDGIPPELLFNGGIALEMALVELFNFMWLNLVWPDNWRRAVLIPLYKGDGSKLDPTNSRMLAMMSVVAKLFEKVLDVRLRLWSERVGMLSDLQGGFRAKRGTTDQMFILNEIIAMRFREQGLPVYMTFIDVRKAYDRVWRPGLWFKLREAGVTGRTLSMLRVMYSKVLRTVMINGSLTEEFDVEAGVPQGAVLSPLLYATYINGLHEALRAKGLGVWVYGRLVPLLLYADDIVLLSTSADQTQRMHNVVTEYARKWRFNVNNRKTKVVIYASAELKREAELRTWSIGGSPIEVADHYKYLGAEVGDVRGKWNRLMRRLYDKTKNHINLLLWQGGGSRGLPARTMTHLWNTTSRTKAEYACELWEGEISQAWVTKMESLQTTLCKAALGQKANPAAVGLRMELALNQLQYRRQALKLLFWERLCNADPDRLLAVVFRRRHSEALDGGARHSWHQATSQLMARWGISHAWRARKAGPEWHDTIETIAKAHATHSNTVALISSSRLRLYRSLRRSEVISPYLDGRYNLKGLWLKTALRLGQALLMERIASVLKWPAVAGTCLLCRNGSVEDTTHFVQECPSLSSQRLFLDKVLDKRLSHLGRPGDYIIAKMRKGGLCRLKLLLGSEITFPTTTTHEDVRLYQEQCAKALWVLDTASKNFFLAAWRYRTSVIGELKIVGSRLVRTPPAKPFVTPTPTADDEERCDPPDQRFWRQWLIHVLAGASNTGSRRREGKQKKKRSNFFAVWRGRKTGVFYKWSDCREAIRGHPAPEFRGFSTLEEATCQLRLLGPNSDM